MPPLLLDGVPDRGRHGRGERAEGVAVEVDDPRREQEPLAQVGRGVRGVEVGRSGVELVKVTSREPTARPAACSLAVPAPGRVLRLRLPGLESPVVTVTVGVLALQGDVREHVHALESVGAHAVPVRRQRELDAVDALVIPGGESTTIDKLLRAFELFGPCRSGCAPACRPTDRAPG